MINLYASAINKLTGIVYIKDAIIHCDEPMIVYYDGCKGNKFVTVKDCRILLENDDCCIKYVD